MCFFYICEFVYVYVYTIYRNICFRFARNWNYIDFTYIQHRVLFEVLASAKALNVSGNDSSSMRKFCALDLSD